MEVRKRRMQGSPSNSKAIDADKVAGKEVNKKNDEHNNITELRGSFWLTRIVFIRSLGLLYCKRLQLYLHCSD